MPTQWLAVAALACGADAATPLPPENAAFDAIVKASLDAWHVPGVAVAIVRDGEVVYLKGLGVRSLDAREPVTADTLFPLASCSKGFTTAALAALVDDGKIDWDDPVVKHVPFFHLGDPLADRDVRLRDLLCHRTGLATHDLLWYHAPWSQEEAVRRLGRLPLEKPFRTAFQYQSTTYTAAGFAISAAAHTPWDEFLTTRLIHPLGMDSTVCTSTAAAKFEDRAAGHRINRHGQPEQTPHYPQETANAAGSIYSTARDLTRWLRFQLEDGSLDGKHLVSREALAETHRPQMVIKMEAADRAMQPDTVQLTYGLGWVVQDYRGRRLISHAGMIEGFRCHLTLAPDAKVGVALLCNLHRTRMNQALSNKLIDRLLALPRKDWDAILLRATHQLEAEADQKEQARLAKRHHGTHPSLEPAAYAGVYEHPAYGEAKIKLEDGRLVLRYSDFVGPLEHFEYDTYDWDEPRVGSAHVAFVLGTNGKVESFKLEGPAKVAFTRTTRR
jgi:CubicO group peptidase (beta-lactamase class C family)